MHSHMTKKFVRAAAICAGLLFATGAHATYFDQWGDIDGSDCGGFDANGFKIIVGGSQYVDFVQLHAIFQRKACEYQANPGVLKYTQARYTLSYNKTGGDKLSPLVFDINDTVSKPGGPWVDKTLTKTLHIGFPLPANTIVTIKWELFNDSTKKWEYVNASSKVWTQNP